MRGEKREERRECVCGRISCVLHEDVDSIWPIAKIRGNGHQKDTASRENSLKACLDGGAVSYKPGGLAGQNDGEGDAFHKFRSPPMCLC